MYSYVAYSFEDHRLSSSRYYLLVEKNKVVVEERERDKMPPSRPPARKNSADRDDDSDLGDARKNDKNGADEEEGVKFKYSTADLSDNSKRNTACCVGAMCIICIILAIVLSVVLTGLKDDKDKDNEVSTTDAPTVSPGNAPAPGVDMFLRTQGQVEERC